MRTESTVIVGASVGGVHTARALRMAGYSGRIVLVGDEPILPYDKPPLSKSILAGTQSSNDISLLTRAQSEELGIELSLGNAATRLHVADQQVELDDGGRISYQHLVVSTGARARPSPWGKPDGVHVVRTLEDSHRLRQDLEHGGRLLVVGGGFIGAETAATARRMDLAVSIVEPNRVPMERVLGHEIGERFLRLHQRHGVETVFGVEVQELRGRRGNFQLRLTDGRRLDSDYIVLGIGAIPNDQWLASSGVQIDNGVVCDKHLRAVGAPNIYAVGDVARWQNPRRKQLTRMEHWTNAIEQSAVVAHNITYPEDLTAHAAVEYVWSDQYDWKIQVVGIPGITELRGLEIVEDTTTGQFAALYSSDDQTLSGLVVVNWPRALVEGRRALDNDTPYPEFKQRLERLATAAQHRTKEGVGP
ncbi:MAG TPA: FAD/NAD(P)-binding oxidoreductase [Mycobacterium sp.]|nr:FAD/NAD(P)-binding oxidoreductase [Mycobacterium sp.]